MGQRYDIILTCNPTRGAKTFHPPAPALCPAAELSYLCGHKSICIMEKLESTAGTCPQGMEGIRNVVFDFGGVLIDWNPRYFFKSYFRDDERMEYFLTHVCSPEWNARQDAGRSLAEGVAEAKVLHPEFAEAIDCYYAHFPETLGGCIEQNVERLRRYKAEGYGVYGLTNWAAETFPHALCRFDFLRLLDGIVVSGEEHLSKPDPAIFRLLLSRYGLKAEECLFLDDTPANLEAAAGLGFRVERIVTGQ